MVMLLSIGGATSVSAKQTVIFKGEKTTGNWEWDDIRKYDKSLFANLQVGDVIWLRTDNDVEAATDAKQTYYQVSVSIPTGDPWPTLANSYSVEHTKYWSSSSLTSEQVESIKANGLYIGGHYIKLLELAYGSAFSSTTVEHWDSSSDSWSKAGWTCSEDKDTWGTALVLNNDQLKNCHIGDRITINYTTSAEGEWDARVVLINASSWVNLYDFPAGTNTSVSFVVTEDNYTTISTGDIRLGGCNYVVTSVTLETTNLYYVLNAKYDGIDLSTINGKTINVDLYRKFDWNTTICVPFDIEDVATTFGYSAKAYKLNSLDSDNLIFDETNNIEAGKPYLMTFDMTSVDEGDKTMTKSFEGVIINTTLTNASATGVTFKGNYTTGFGMSGKYGVACKQHGKDWDWGFYNGGSSSTLPAFSAYIESNVTPSRGFSISFDGGTTNIKSSISDEEDNGEIYNLMGVKTNATHKGIYIKNGKKYIAK